MEFRLAAPKNSNTDEPSTLFDTTDTQFIIIAHLFHECLCQNI